MKLPFYFSDKVLATLPQPGDDEDEEMLRRAIAMSLEEEEEKEEKRELAEEELISIKNQGPGELPKKSKLIRVEQVRWFSNQTINFYFSAGSEKEVLATLNSLENDEDGEMLKKAIAMSLEEQ